MRRGGGAIGYLFTDIDGSTERWERAPLAMKQAIARHNEIIGSLIARHGGVAKDWAGDGVFAIFEGGDPLGCAIEIQLAMQREDWTAVGGMALRVGVHASDRSAPVDQLSINRAARITSSGGAGQIVVSVEASHAFQAPAGARFDDLGLLNLRGIDEPLHLFSLVHARLQRTTFPPLRIMTVEGRPRFDSAAPFFGRAREIVEIRRLMASPSLRLLTLVGPGGNGKTRLAARIADDAGIHDTVWFASLEGVSNTDGAIAAIARGLCLSFHGSTSQENQITRHLSDKQGLLILDNAEAFSGAADLLARVADACPRLHILVTSRLPLDLEVETVFQVAGFEPVGPVWTDLGASPAHHLFVHRARANQPGFALSEEEFGAFRELCTLVDGSPLAISLAAQWRHLLSIAGIVARVRDGLDFLRSTEPDAPQRHRSLRAVFEGTWSLLAADEREALARLAVFSNGFDAHAAEAIALVDISLLASLERRGLVERRKTERLSLHPLIQEYAAEKLASMGDEARIVHRRHSSWFLTNVRDAYRDMANRDQAAMLDGIDHETRNLLSAWRHALEHGPRVLADGAAEAIFYGLALRARFNEALAFFDVEVDERRRPYFSSLAANCQVQKGGMDAATSAATSALNEPSAPPPARAHALQALGIVAHAKGEFAAAREHYHAALAIRRRRRDHMGCYFSLASLAVLHLGLTELAEARACIKQCFSLCRILGNTSGMLMVHFLAGEVAAQDGRHDDAAKNYRRALEVEERVHHLQHRARILIKLGALLAARGSPADALEHHEQALRLAKELGDQHRAATALLEIGADLRMDDRLPEAKARLVEAVRIALKLGARPLVIRGLFELAQLEAAAGDQQRAWRLCSILAGAPLGPFQTAYDAFAAGLPVFAPMPSSTPEIAAGQIIEEADLAPLRL